MKTDARSQVGKRPFIFKLGDCSLPSRTILHYLVGQKQHQGTKLPLALISASGNFGSLMLVLTVGRQKFIFKLWCGVEGLAAKQFEVAQTRIDVSERNWELWLGRLGLREKSLTL